MISAIQNATWTVVISRGQSRNPQKRALEQAIAEAAQQMDGVNVLVIPHLYDLPKASESYQKLSDIEGDLIVVSWIYSRAAHWVLDRNGIQGQVGEVELGEPMMNSTTRTDDDASDDANGSSDRAELERAGDVDRVTDLYPRPDRNIHCIDLKVSERSGCFCRRNSPDRRQSEPGDSRHESADHRRKTGSG